MIRLIEPSEEYLASYMEAYDDYMRHGGGDFGMTNAREEDIFAKYRRYREAKDLPSDRVGSDAYWLVEEETRRFLGEVSIRHGLNEALRLCGGHIGYVIRRDCWNQGYGTQMLALALEKAKQRGLNRVLITCNEKNIGSARVMEKNGCILEDKVRVERNGEMMLIRRYWKSL